MKDSTMKVMVQQADAERGPLSKMAKDSIEQGIVLVTKLEEALANSNYIVDYEDRKNTTVCRILLDSGLVAYGLSGNGREDALLQAFSGAVREEVAAHHVDLKLSNDKIEVDENT